MFSLRISLLIFCALLLLVGGASPANAQRAVWAQLIPGDYYGGQGPQSATDTAGNTYVCSAFTDRLSLGGFTITSRTPGDLDMYVAKFDPAGHVLWLRAGGAPVSLSWTGGNDFPAGLAVDRQGDLFITGLTGAGFALGALSIDSSGHYLAKLDGATGTPRWLQRLESRNRRFVAFDPINGGSYAPTRLTTDAAGNCYMVGQSSNLDSLGGLPMVGRGYWDENVIAKCDGAGRFLWATQVFGPERALMYMYAHGLAVDRQGAVTFAGEITGGPYLFGSLTAPVFTLTGTDTARMGNNSDAFIARLAPNGTPLWVKHGRGPTPGGATTGEGFRHLMLDAVGNTYLIGGSSEGGLWLDGVQCLAAGSSYRPFMMKLDPQGALAWVRNDHHLGSPGVNIRGLTLDPSGHPLVTGTYTYMAANPQVGPFALPPAVPDGNGGGANCWLAAYTPQGVVRWARTASEPNRSSAFGFQIGTDAAGHIYVMGANTRDASRATYDGQVVQGRGTFVLRFDEAAQITGTIYLDQNANGQRDPGEGPFPRPVVISETARPYAATSSPATGRFTVFADTGAYQLQLPQVPAYYTVRQGAAGYSGHLRSYGQTDTARVFGLAPIASRTDVRVTLTPYTAARRGFVNRYRVRVENIGTAPATGQVSVQFDPRLVYLGAAPAPAQQAGSTVQWNFSGLAPFGTRDFDLSLNIPLNVALGTIIRSRATGAVPNDLDPTNDVDSTRQTVIGSWDPNELTVNYSTLTPAQIAAGTELDYIIHFQNLGTDTAFTVVLTDTLPAHLLQLGTLYVVSQSHNCRVDLLGNRQLVIRFDNINLPPNRTSALESGGFIRFRVRPRPTLVAGELIPNTAHIVFDYNAPLATNRVTTLVQTPNGLVAEPGAGDATMRLYPNPATETVTLTSAEAGATVTLFDGLGRTVSTSHLAPRTSHLNLRGLLPGLYVVRLTRPDGRVTSQRLVVR